MTALSAPRVQNQSNTIKPDGLDLPVKATTQIWHGGGVMLADGYLAPAGDTSGFTLCVPAGVAAQSVLGGASNGTEKCRVHLPESNRIVEATISASAIVAADLGKPCYWTDDATVQLSSTNRPLAGIVVGIISTTAVKVMLCRAIT